MVWDYLSLFWDKIVAIGDYSIQWFQNIGNAVAGALGLFFDFIFHNLNDIFVILAWLANYLKIIFTSLLAPLSYFFTFIKTFFSIALSTPASNQLAYSLPANIAEFFNAVPNFSILSSVMGYILILVIGIASLRLLLHT
jgi:hypothetical protein